MFRHGPRLLLRLRCDAPLPPPADSAPPTFPLPLRLPPLPGRADDADADVSLGAEIVTGPMPAKRVPDELPELRWRLEPVQTVVLTYYRGNYEKVDVRAQSLSSGTRLPRVAHANLK
ncbi:hypothetical protein BC827DRAFT_1382581 [Russula dissimulans]|nr:hypothetical protein BC827DRAFT_1382581 [Russula dissimulans]